MVTISLVNSEYSFLKFLKITQTIMAHNMMPQAFNSSLKVQIPETEA